MLNHWVSLSLSETSSTGRVAGLQVIFLHFCRFLCLLLHSEELVLTPLGR